MEREKLKLEGTTMGFRSLFKAISLLSALVLLGPRIATAQTSYPSRTIKIVVAFAAGGTTDVIARLLGQKISEYTGTSVIIENIPGAATNVGAVKVARSDPDGYTLFLTNSTTFATNPNFHHNLNYSLDDFEPITLISRIPQILDVNPKFPASNVKEFIAYAKSKPNGLTIATAGAGSFGEIVNGMTRGILDISVTNVPYRGGEPALVDVIKGIVDAFYDNISTSLPMYHSGLIKPLAITGRERSPFAPEVPTFSELGYKDFVAEILFIVLARKGTPRPIIDKLNGLIHRAMDDPRLKEALLKQGVVPEPSTPEEAKVAIEEDYEFNARMVKQFKIAPIE